MTEQGLRQQLYLNCACGQKIPLPVAVSSGKPIPWPKGDPVQNFCCPHCWEARPYSKGDVRRDDVGQSLRDLKVWQLLTSCESCEGLVEILYVADRRAIETWMTTFRKNVDDYEKYVRGAIHFKGLPCTRHAKHKNKRANGLELSSKSEVDKNWEKIQSQCAAQER